VKLRTEEITSILKQRIEDYSVSHGETHGSPVGPLLHSSPPPSLDGLRSGKARLRLPTVLSD
jgi:hypothetical protein